MRQIPVALWRINHGTWLTYTQKRVTEPLPEEAPHLKGEHLLARPYPTGPCQVQPSCGSTPTEDAVGVGCNVAQTATSGLMVQSSVTEIRSWIMECHLSGRKGPQALWEAPSQYGGTACLRAWQRISIGFESTLWLGHSQNPHFTLFFDQWTHCCVSHYCPAATSNCTWNSGHKLVARWSPSGFSFS